MTLPVVAIVGRPNVGKSTLFNRILGRRQAVVHDEPGVTRDRHYSRVDWNRRSFYLVDTGGLTYGSNNAILRHIRTQAEEAMREADLILFLVDGLTMPTSEDEEVARRLYKEAHRVMLVVNKVDRDKDEWESGTWNRLGLGEPWTVSALHGRSVGDLLSEVCARLPRVKAEVEAEDSIRVAVVGRPNVGKSSLVNALLGQERMVVDDVPGTTRDAIDSEIVHEGQRYTLVDTAGLRRKSKVKDLTEYFSGVRTRQSLERCHVALILLEANLPISAQDVKIAAEVAELNRGAILVLNKWDLVEEKQTNTSRDMEQEIRDRLPFMDYAAAIFLSALTKKRITGLYPLIKAVHAQATRKFTTGELNRFFERIQKRNPAPASRGGLSPKIYYAVQTGTLPPTFNLFVNHPKAVAPNWVRYLEHQMRDELQLTGTPVAFKFRKSE